MKKKNRKKIYIYIKDFELYLLTLYLNWSNRLFQTYFESAFRYSEHVNLDTSQSRRKPILLHQKKWKTLSWCVFVPLCEILPSGVSLSYSV